jgi:hypothetical protein
MRKAILAAALLTLPVLPAVAADNGFYLGGSIGQANVQIDDVTDNTFPDDDFDADDTGFKLIAGIRPLDWLAVEAAYVNFGEPEDRVAGFPLEAEGDGISAFAVGFLPTGPVDLFAKVGIIAWDSKITGAAFDDDGSDLAYGVGAQFRVLSFSIRAEYEKFDISDVDVDMISVGLTYTFL